MPSNQPKAPPQYEKDKIFGISKFFSAVDTGFHFLLLMMGCHLVREECLCYRKVCVEASVPPFCRILELSAIRWEAQISHCRALFHEQDSAMNKWDVISFAVQGTEWLTKSIGWDFSTWPGFQIIAQRPLYMYLVSKYVTTVYKPKDSRTNRFHKPKVFPALLNVCGMYLLDMDMFQMCRYACNVHAYCEFREHIKQLV